MHVQTLVEALKQEVIKPIGEMISKYAFEHRSENKRHEVALAAIQLLPYHLEKSRGTKPNQEDCREAAFKNAVKDAQLFLKHLE